MLFQVLIPGFLLGLISSFHCVGMCGPLALSLPIHSYSFSKKIISILLYNSGRVVSYSFIGVVFGFFGRQFYLAGLQQILSMVLGIMLLLFLIVSSFKHLPVFKPGNIFYYKMQAIISGLINKSSARAIFLTGIANGFLPCGMVYLAIGGALVFGNIISATGFMLAFGIGTWPLMLVLSFAGLFVSLPVRKFIRNLSPFIIASIALLLILRGLNLDIPYISPLFHQQKDIIECH